MRLARDYSIDRERRHARCRRCVVEPDAQAGYFVKRKSGRRDAEPTATAFAKPLHDEVDVELNLGRPPLVIALAQAKAMDVAIVPAEIVEVRGRPCSQHGFTRYG